MQKLIRQAERTYPKMVDTVKKKTKTKNSAVSPSYTAAT